MKNCNVRGACFPTVSDFDNIFGFNILQLSGTRDQGSGNRDMDQGTGIREQGSGYRDQGSGIRQQETVNCEL